MNKEELHLKTESMKESKQKLDAMIESGELNSDEMSKLSEGLGYAINLFEEMSKPNPYEFLEQMSHEFLTVFIESYDEYIIRGFETHDTGWVPVCIREFFDCEFKEDPAQFENDKIIIEVEGGLVQSVTTNFSHAEVLIVDRDMEGADGDEIGDIDEIRGFIGYSNFINQKTKGMISDADFSNHIIYKE